MKREMDSHEIVNYVIVSLPSLPENLGEIIM